MLVWTLKTFFGKVIGLDLIPKEKRQKFLKEIVIPLAKAAAISAAKSGGKEVMVSMTKRF